MAFEVARAYDENKNLVPLYILTDGEVPEVSPGFDFVVSYKSSTSYDLTIVSNSSNPTGGVISKDVNLSITNSGNNCTINVANDSDFNVSVSMDIIAGLTGNERSRPIVTELPITINSKSSASIVFESPDTNGVCYIIKITLSISRL